MIEVEHLWKVYESVEAVRDLSFRVEPGEVLGLVGPNGAGKTTTMRCLCGIIPPSAGELWVCGISMYEDPVEVKRQVAFVPSEPRFFPYLTVWEHLQMFARLYGSGEQGAYAEELIEAMTLTEKRDHLPGALSRGMQQKLMIACALIHHPRVLIFDEPFTGLDPLAIRKIRKLLRERANDGAAVLISSHLLAMVEDMVDQVLIIQSGVKIAHGSLSSLAARIPALRGKTDLEEIFLHATGSQEEASEEAAPKPTEASSEGLLEESEAPGSEAPGSEAPGSEAPGSEVSGSEVESMRETGELELPGANESLAEVVGHNLPDPPDSYASDSYASDSFASISADALPSWGSSDRWLMAEEADGPLFSTETSSELHSAVEAAGAASSEGESLKEVGEAPLSRADSAIPEVEPTPPEAPSDQGKSPEVKESPEPGEGAQTGPSDLFATDASSESAEPPDEAAASREASASLSEAPEPPKAQESPKAPTKSGEDAGAPPDESGEADEAAAPGKGA